MRESFFQSLRPGQMLDSLFEAVPEVYYFYKDSESRFMGGSQSFANLFGESSMESMIGKTDYDFCADFLADAFHADDRKVMGSGKPQTGEIELVPSEDGSLDWLQTTKIPLYGVAGEVVGLAGVARMIPDTDAVYADHPEMHEIVQFVRAHYREKISVVDMAEKGGISISSQERLFRKTFGSTPSMYLRRTRLNAACTMLRESDVDLPRIALSCGLGDQTNMTRAFRKELRITPMKYRRRFSGSGKRLKRIAI
jgi:AraC-like DNA-binding protein